MTKQNCNKSYRSLLAFLLLFLFAFFLLAGRIPQKSVAATGMEGISVHESAHQLISDYIAAQYGWTREEYTVESYFPLDRKLPESIAMFTVLHNDDLTPKAPGAGKSVILEVDMQAIKILSERGFQ